MSAPAQQFHLLVEALGSAAAPSPQAAAAAELSVGLRPLAVPFGVWLLSAPLGEPLRLAPAAPAATEQALVLEAVAGPHQPQLVLISPAEHRPRVNGQPVPRLAVLNVKDQLQLGDDCILHVTLFNCPSIDGPSPETIGKECPLCRTTFQPDTTVYVCPACGTAMHCEGDDKPGDRLECARIASECPVCGAAVVMQQGYAYIPERSDG